MEYGLSDSSGTDDDLPPTHQNRFTGGGRAASNGRSTGFGNSQFPRVHSDMEDQIHQIEQEAYSSVLRAFKAQSDAITWEKESLITELRKELRVSDEEHRVLLSRVNADDVIRRIREWRKARGPQPGMLSSSKPVHDPLPSHPVKKQKTSQSLSLGARAPSPTLQQPSRPPSSSSLKQGPVSKNPKPSASTGFGGRAQVANQGSGGSVGLNEPTNVGQVDPLIGRKVWTRWPEDNSFYEAVITDFNPADGCHALVYDIGTPDEAWEWVNLKKISPDDIRWKSEDIGVSHGGGHSGSGRGVKKSMADGGPPPAVSVRGRGSVKGLSKKEFALPQNGVGKKDLPPVIRLLNTENLIKEVEKVFSASNPDPMEIDNAKEVLKEHEQALVDAIAKLVEASDGESDRQRKKALARRKSVDREGSRRQYKKGLGEGKVFEGSNGDRAAKEEPTSVSNQQDAADYMQ